MYYLRVSLTDRCNLRCTYCLPEQVRFAPNRASTDEVKQLMSLIHETVGVYKIRLTGGEPTLHADLIDFIKHARSICDLVGMTSNGILLAPLLTDLKQAGLQRINISLDTADSNEFKSLTRREGFEQVIESIREAKALNFSPVKVNCVAMQNTDFHGMVQLAQWEQFHLRFIELMAIGEALPWQKDAYIDADDIRQRLADQGTLLNKALNLDEATSRVWTIPDLDPMDCSIGFITTSSDPFCATCDRIRLSSHGKLFNCLMDNTGIDLLEPLRNNNIDEVRARISQWTGAKKAPEHFIRYENMAAIGG